MNNVLLLSLYQLKLLLLPNFSIEAIRSWRKHSTLAGSTVFSDTLPGFLGLKNHHTTHHSVNITNKHQ